MKRLNIKLIKLFITFFVLAIVSLQAFAHTKLISSVPEDGATLISAPKEITLKFENGIRLTTVTLTRSGDKTIKLQLDKKVTFQTDYSLVTSNMNLGEYLLEWRGLGEDGHVLIGKFTYNVK